MVISIISLYLQISVCNVKNVAQQMSTLDLDFIMPRDYFREKPLQHSDDSFENKNSRGYTKSGIIKWKEVDYCELYSGEKVNNRSIFPDDSLLGVPKIRTDDPMVKFERKYLLSLT